MYGFNVAANLAYSGNRSDRFFGTAPRNLTILFLLGFELRMAKSTASWSRADLEVVSGRAARMAFRRARGPAGRGAEASGSVGASGRREAGLSGWEEGRRKPQNERAGSTSSRSKVT
jgi:hypothetical protein